MLLSSGSEEGEAAPPRTHISDRLDILALEALPLPMLREQLEGKHVLFRSIVEEQNCPVISAEQSAQVVSVPNQHTLEVRLLGAPSAQLLPFNTLYLLRLAPQGGDGCSAPDCSPTHHALFKQVCFYFSARNIARDEFVQRQLARNGGKGMDAQLLLNFPRVRRTGLALQSVLAVLAAHQGHPAATYELQGNVICPKAA